MKKITSQFLESKGFTKRETPNGEFYEKNNVAITFDNRVNKWILCIIFDNMIRYLAPPLYIEYDDELIKYYRECTGLNI